MEEEEYPIYLVTYKDNEGFIRKTFISLRNDDSLEEAFNRFNKGIIISWFQV